MKRILDRLLWAISGATLVVYPFLVWFGWNRLSARTLGALLALLLGVRFLGFGRKSHELAPAALIPLVPVLLGTAFGESRLFLWYPALVSGSTLVWFAASLRSRPAVERFARLRHPELPPEAVRHCRDATWAWVIFLAINTSMAAVTALRGDLNLWTIWNGAVFYSGMGLMFSGEYAVRRLRGVR